MNNMHQVYVGIGSNIDRKIHISNGIRQLIDHFKELQLSPVYITQAVGFDGDDFYNLVAGFKTTLTVKEIESRLKQIERDNGRDHSQAKFSARTLDIDLLLYDDDILHSQGFAVPRDEILKYAFVLKPLADIAGATIHPETGRSIQSHWEGFNHNEEEMRLLEWDIKHTLSP